MRTKKKPKSFFEMSAAERDAVAAELAKGTDYRDTRPLSPRDMALWNAAKQGRGRPRKPLGSKAVPVRVTFEPALLKRMDAYTKAKGMSRAQLLARGAELAMTE